MLDKSIKNHIFSCFLFLSCAAQGAPKIDPSSQNNSDKKTAAQIEQREDSNAEAAPSSKAELLQNSAENKEQDVIRQPAPSTALQPAEGSKQPKKSDFSNFSPNLTSLIMPFLEAKDFINLASTSKEIAKKILTMPSHQYPCSKFKETFLNQRLNFDLMRMLNENELLEFLQNPNADKKKLLKKYMDFYNPYFKLTNLRCEFLDQQFPQWKQTLVDLKIPLIVAENPLVFLQDPILLPNIVFVQFNASDLGSYIELNPKSHAQTLDLIFSTIKSNKILISIKDDDESLNLDSGISDFVLKLGNTGQIVKASMMQSALKKSKINFESVLELHLEVRKLHEFAQTFNLLNSKTPKLQSLRIERVDSTHEANECIPTIVTLNNLVTLKDLKLVYSFNRTEPIHFYRAASLGDNGIRHISQLQARMKAGLASAIAEGFPHLFSLEAAPSIVDTSLANWVSLFSKNKGLEVLKLHLLPTTIVRCGAENLVSPLEEVQSKNCILPQMKKLYLFVENSEKINDKKFSDEVLRLFPLLGMNQEDPNQNTSAKKIFVLTQNHSASVALFCLKLLRFSGSHVQLVIPNSVMRELIDVVDPKDEKRLKIS